MIRAPFPQWRPDWARALLLHYDSLAALVFLGRRFTPSGRGAPRSSEPDL
jgi:hypothetical protein